MGAGSKRRARSMAAKDTRRTIACMFVQIMKRNMTAANAHASIIQSDPQVIRAQQACLNGSA